MKIRTITHKRYYKLGELFLSKKMNIFTRQHLQDWLLSSKPTAFKSTLLDAVDHFKQMYLKRKQGLKAESKPEKSKENASPNFNERYWYEDQFVTQT